MLKFATREDDLFWARVISISTLFIAVVWLAQTFLPLRRQIQEKRQLVQRVEKDIELATTDIRRLKEEQINSAKQREELKTLLPRHAAGSATVWLPKLAREHFSLSNIPTGVIRLNTVVADEKYPGINHTYVSVEIPGATPEVIKALLLAGADLEERNPTIRFVDFIVNPDPLDPSTQTASLNLQALDRN
ncbi:MAG TPA: hypothetical protein VF585_00110 [Chthoniobacterales bacterium]|jgi:hypothetical protein